METTYSDEEKPVQYHCYACGESEELDACDQCTRRFHLYCNGVVVSSNQILCWPCYSKEKGIPNRGFK